MEAAILGFETPLLRLRAEFLFGVAVAMYDRIAALENLEWPPHSLEMIVLRRPRFFQPERFKIGRVDEIAHGHTVHVERFLFDGVTDLVSPPGASRPFAPHSSSGI